MQEAPHTFKRYPLATQTIVLTLGTFLFFILYYGLPVSNVVLHNYYLGGRAFVQGQNPYEVTLANGPSNQFKYSPLFAVIAAGMAAIKSQRVVTSAWILLSMGTFYLGLGRWVQLTNKVPALVTYGVILAVLELTFSLLLTQANALIIGMTLIALAEYRDSRLFSAGAILILATNLKVYPLIFLVPLLFTFQPRFWFGALVAGIAAFLLPALFSSWSHNLKMHVAWMQLVVNNSGGPGILDIASAMERAGLANLGRILRWSIALVTVPIFVGVFFIKRREVAWQPWMAFGISALLLLSPRTDIFTYVMLAPSFVLMLSWFGASQDRGMRIGGSIAIGLFAFAIVSCQFIDPKWLISETPTELLRVLGTLGIWIMTGALLLMDMTRKRFQSHSSQPAAT